MATDKTECTEAQSLRPAGKRNTGRPPAPWHAMRRKLAAAALLPLFVAAYYLSFLLRFEFAPGPREWHAIAVTIWWFVAIKVVVFAALGAFQGWGRFVTFYDLMALVQAATAGLLVTVLVDRLVVHAKLIPRSIFLLDWGVTIVLVGGALSLCRLWQEGSWRLLLTRNKIPALIVGANEAGEALLRAIIRNGKLTYHVLGFLDDDPQRIGTRIGGVRVLGTVDQTCRLAERYGVREVLIAAGSLPGKQVRAIIEEAREYNIDVKVLPSYEQLIEGSVTIRPRKVCIDDLLGREPVRLDLSNIRQWIDDRVLLVTGSAGSIGSEICRQLLRFAPRKLVAVDRSETGQFFLERELRPIADDTELVVTLGDILDSGRLGTLLRQHRPQIIFHAAAYKHVPLMESHPGEAVKNIIAATRRLADSAITAGAESLVMISTDKAVNPTSVMGACKRAAELYVQSLTDVSPCRFITVRFGNVLDSAGSVVQVFRQQIAAGGPVTVTDPEMRRFFMTIPEAAQLVIQAGAIGQSGEILLLDMGVPVRIVDLAHDMIRLSGLRPGEDVEIEFVGLRPGEKLYEELHADGEKHLPTRHPKIMIADRTPRDPAALLAAIERLEQMAEADPQAVVAELQRIVPEYRPAGRAVPLPRREAA